MRYSMRGTRVSSEEQANSGHGLNAQLDAVRAYAGEEKILVYSDEGVSGTVDLEKRENLYLAIQALSKG
ncbi:recombinase family protein [Myxococcota bacterium]|nr:recombinase family protein [Myxococcota bacterium]MBU1536920.1 recombinase family protein [Myxococcota bacterium]